MYLLYNMCYDQRLQKAEYIYLNFIIYIDSVNGEREQQQDPKHDSGKDGCSSLRFHRVARSTCASES